MHMGKVDQLFQEAARLPDDQKFTLANRILASSEPQPTEEVEREWDVSIRDRIQRYDQGAARCRPAGDVFSELDRKLSR